jgi:hypothetical protein
MRQNTDLHQDKCFLEERTMPTNEPALFFIMNFKTKKVVINCSRNWMNMDISEDYQNSLKHSKSLLVI